MSEMRDVNKKMKNNKIGLIKDIIILLYQYMKVLLIPIYIIPYTIIKKLIKK